MKITVGYNKLIISLPVILGLILSYISYTRSLQGIEITNSTYFLIVGLFIFSVPMYFIPYVVVTEKEIWVNNQFGMPRRRAPIKSLKDIRFEKGTIYVTSDDYERKLYFNKYMVDIKSLKKLREAVENTKF